jgi:hypothetical protein
MNATIHRTKYLDLTYYKRQQIKIPAILFPFRTEKIDYNIGSIFDYTKQLSTSFYGENLYKKFYRDTHLALFSELSKTHGQFLERFLSNEINAELRKEFLNSQIDIKEINEWQTHYFKFDNRPRKNIDIVSSAIHNYIHALIYNNNSKEIYDNITDWEIANSFERTCEVCSKKYKVADFPDWLYFGASGHKTICFECPVYIPSNEDDTLSLICKLISQCGFIPNSDFSPNNNRFASRIKTANWSSTVKTIFDIGLSTSENIDSPIKKYFGSWFIALVKAGVLEDNVIITKRGIKCIASSGNECNSLDEQFIDNWLFNRGIVPKKEPLYPKHSTYNPSGRRRADWLVNDYYVEYFGLRGEKIYDIKTEEKILLAKSLDLKLICIFPEDLTNLEALLGPILII